MSLWTKIKGAVIDALSDARLVEAAGATAVSSDENGWRRLSGGSDPNRDLTPMSQDRMQRFALHLWERNILANRIIELPLAYMLSEGVTVSADNEEVKGWITQFWTDPINSMNIKLAKKARQLAIFGEQCYPVFVNEVSGHVRLGYLDPANIAEVIRDPDNPEQPIGVITTRDKKGQYLKYRIVINGAEDVFTQRTQAIRAGFSDGECFYFAVNDLSNGARGRSDLLHLTDWLIAYDDFLFAEQDRIDKQLSHVWDIELKGATDSQCIAKAKEIASVGIGDIRVHNESEIWKTSAPALNASDTSVYARLARNHILAGASLPEHWLGGGGDVNRATAAEMPEPTFKIFTMRQTYIGYMLEEMIRFVIRKRSGLDEIDWSDERFKFSVRMPEMVNSDITKYTASLAPLIGFCATAIQEGLITKVRALEFINAISSRMGVEIDAQSELEAAQTELAEREDKQTEDDVYQEPANDQGDDPAMDAAA